MQGASLLPAATRIGLHALLMALVAILIAILAAILVGLSSPASAQGGAAPYRVVLLGDSITAGMISGPPAPPYADVLAVQLGTDFEVTNIGCGGATSADWLPDATWPWCASQNGLIVLPNFFAGLALPNLPADFATILLGTNDAVGFFEPAPIEPVLYRANLDVLVDSLLLEGTRTVVLMTPPPNVGHQADPVDGRLQGYRAELADLCNIDPDVLCGPDLYGLLDHSDFAGGDIHPNASGHEKIALALAADLLAHTPVEARADLLFSALPFSSLSRVNILPIVVYSSLAFDAVAEIDRTTLRFGSNGNEDSLVLLPNLPQLPNPGEPACLPADIDRDGARDLICAFDAARTGLAPDATEAWLEARLRDGTALSAHVIRPAATTPTDTNPGQQPASWTQ